MEPKQVIQILENTHTNFARDYIDSLIKDHAGENLFTRFVANVKLKRFIDYCITRRFRVKEIAEYTKINQFIEPLILSDWNLLFTKEEFNDFRNLHLNPVFNSNATPGIMTSTKFDEGEFENLFKYRNYNPEYYLALKEFIRYERDPYTAPSSVLTKLYQEDLQEFRTQLNENNLNIHNEKNAPTKLVEPEISKWKYDIQYLGFIVADLIDEDRNLKILPLSKAIAQYFKGKNNKPIKFSTIRSNILQFRNHKEDISELIIADTNRIKEKESDKIQAVIDFFINSN